MKINWLIILQGLAISTFVQLIIGSIYIHPFKVILGIGLLIFLFVSWRN